MWIYPTKLLAVPMHAELEKSDIFKETYVLMFMQCAKLLQYEGFCRETYAVCVKVQFYSNVVPHIYHI
jgi:hypothetical protein